MKRDTKIYKRRHYLVDKKIQYRYVSITLRYLFIFFVMTIVIIYFTAWKELIEKLSNVYPQARLVSIMNTIYLRLFIGLLLLIPFAAATALLASHKIAGPLVRIKKALDDIAGGNYDFKIKLREKDLLKDVAAQLNKIAEALKNKK